MKSIINEIQIKNYKEDSEMDSLHMERSLGAKLREEEEKRKYAKER